MSAQLNAGASLASEAPARKLLDELRTLYPLWLVTDREARVLLTSDAWKKACGESSEFLGLDLRESIKRMPRPEQSNAIFSGFEKHGFLLRAPVDVTVGHRVRSFDFSIMPLPAGPEPPLGYLLIARPNLAPRRSPAPDSILESCGDAILAVEEDGFLCYANLAAAKLLGTTSAELVGGAIAALASRTQTLSRLLVALEDDSPTQLELELRRLDGDSLTVAASVAPRHDADGRRRGAVLSLRAVSSDLARRNSELEHCVNSLAHDLRSPLVALLGFSRLLRQDYGDRLDDTGAHFVDRIEQSGRTMEALIHDLLELSRIGQPGEHPTMIDPRTVLLQLAAELKPRLDASHVELEFPEHPPLVYCDRTRLYQVFSNLIGNALEHMGASDDPRILVEVVEEKDHHRISVRDFGRGIDPRFQEQIFDAFQSLGAQRDGRRGTGMGLAIVRRIAQTRGGRAWVESGPGHGATFHLTLPRH